MYILSVFDVCFVGLSVCFLKRYTSTTLRIKSVSTILKAGKNEFFFAKSLKFSEVQTTHLSTAS